MSTNRTALGTGKSGQRRVGGNGHLGSSHCKLEKATFDSNRILLNMILPDDSLVINEYNPDEYNQKYHCTNNLVQHNEDGNCLDIAGCDEEDMARVCTWEEHGGDNQLWTFDHM